MIQQSMSLKVLILPLSLVIAVIVAIFFVKPGYYEMADAKIEMNQEKVNLGRVQSQIQKLEALKAKLDTMQEEKNLVATAVPEGEDADAYLSEIASKASRSGVMLSDVEFKKQESTMLEFPTYACNLNNQVGMMAASPMDGENAQIEPTSCLNIADVSLTAIGNWNQLLDFLKYIEDMNRISNIQKIDIVSPEKTEEQTASNLLSVEITSSVFFMQKTKTNEAALISSLADQGSFNQKAIDKLREVIFAPYSTPAVSPGGSRNLFE